MSKTCPECGNEVPDEAHFCADCGYDFFKKSTSRSLSRSSDSIFSNGKIFLALIAVVLVVGAIVILSSGFGGGNDNTDVKDVVEHAVDLTITEVSGWDSESSSKTSYTLYTKAIFNKLPSNLKGYNVRTTYLDETGKEIGHEIETLDDVYYDSNYALSFGYYKTYKKPDPDYVTVEIIKDGKTVDNFTSKIDQSKIDFLN